MCIENLQITDEFTEKILNPENPLLIKFKEKAPGTFQHSETVSRLCEKIGRGLKLNLNVLKIIGMYHDIGKIRYPQYFCENHSNDGQNPHDTIDPFISYKIITSHVADGISILVMNVPEMPIELIRCMAMHHGDSVMQSIYSKFIDENKPPIDTFRYPYPKPKDVYSCILMICDCVEATTKALVTSGQGKPEVFEEAINNTIKRLSESEQLDELKLRELRIIKEVLQSEYSAINHLRVTNGYEENKKDLNN